MSPHASHHILTFLSPDTNSSSGELQISLRLIAFLKTSAFVQKPACCGRSYPVSQRYSMFSAPKHTLFITKFDQVLTPVFA